MKLTPSLTPYSSIVGGGLVLSSEDKRHQFIVNFMGTSSDITREESDQLSRQIADLIDKAGGLVIDDRK